VAADDFVIIGRLGRTRGVRGDLWITPDTDFPERFLILKEVYVEERGQWRRRRIADTRLIGARPTIRFEGVTNRETAARLTNQPLAVLRSEIVRPPEGSHFIHDLASCQVYEQASGRLLGYLRDVERYPANDVYVIELKSGRTIRFPAVAALVKEIDIARKRIVIDPAGFSEANDTDADSNE
jgi:16S rRNA processing protein RimM